MKPPRDHHFIPRFLLAQWEMDPGGKLVEYSLKNEKLIPKAVGAGATGFQSDLYSFPELPPESAQFLEQEFFNYLDDTAARALAINLTNEGEWTNELVNAWSRFMLGIHLRHPDAIPELRSAAATIWDRGGPATQAEYERIREADDPVTFTEFLANRDPLAKTKIVVNMIIKAFDNEIVVSHLNKMHKYTIDVWASPHTLLLSDRPVCFSNLLQRNGIVFLPLSPTKLFVAANEDAGLSKIRKMPARELVKNINVFVVSRARKFVWSRDRSQESFLRKYMSTKMETLPLFRELDKVETQEAVSIP